VRCSEAKVQEDGSRSASVRPLINVARLVLRALLGAKPEVEVRGRRYRLELEKVFRLEEVGGGFVYYLRNAGALERRLEALAGSQPGSGRELAGNWAGIEPKN
jgi:hypothetical protein